MQTFILAYVPVLHEGYARLFADHPDLPILLIPRDLAMSVDPECGYLRKDLRALDAEAVATALRAWYPLRLVHVTSPEQLATLNDVQTRIVLPDEDVSRAIAQKYLPWNLLQFVEVFLRWDRQRVMSNETVHHDRTLPFEGLAADMLRLAAAESRKATNWWRRVGAVIARDGDVLLMGHNTHVPSPHLAYAEGDPRSLFKRGVHIELTTDHHAEARLISEAARRGLALAGADLYLTTFPCPPCAKDVAHAGIRRCFFSSGYAMLDGERVLKDAGVELIFVEEKDP